MQAAWKRVLLGGSTIVVALGIAAPATLPAVRILLALTYLGVARSVLRRTKGKAPHIRLFGYGLVSAVAGAIVRLVHGYVVGEDYPFPSPADLLGYLFYVYLILGAGALVRARSRERRFDDAIDAALVGVLAFSLQYCVVLDRYLTDVGEPLGERLVNGGFAVATTLLVVMCARISFGPGTRNGSYYLLAAAVTIAVVNDTGLQLQAADRLDLAWLTGVLAPLGLVVTTAAILHPESGFLADRPSLVEDELSPLRQAFLFVSALYGIGAVVWMARRGSDLGLVVATVSTVAAFALSIVRMTLMVTEQRASLSTEKRLRVFTSASSTAMTSAELERRAADFLMDVARDVLPGRVVIGRGPDPEASLWSVDPDPVVADLLIEDNGEWQDRLERGLGMFVDDVALEALDGAPGSIAVVTAPARAGGTIALYVESSILVTRRRKALLESFVVQLSLLFDSVESAAELHRKKSDERFRTLVQDSNDIVCLVERESLAVTFIGPTLDRLLGYAEERALGVSPLTIMHPDDRTHVEAEIVAASGSDGDAIELAPVDVRLRHRNGHHLWFSLSIRDLAHETDVDGLLFSFADIHERKMAEIQLSSAEARYRALVTNSNDVMTLVKDGTITYVTPNVERMFGMSAADLIGAQAMAFLNERTEREIDELFEQGMLTRFGTVMETELATASGASRIVELTFSDPALGDDHVMVTIRDVTERQRLEASLRDQALYDRLTGMFNRASIHPELQRGLQGLEPGQQIGVLHLDVTDFKSINDSLGFEMGDALLVEIATRLRAALRRSDTIARLNGDEFAIVTIEPTTERVTSLAVRLRHLFDEPFELGVHSIKVGVSIGIVITDDRSEVATRLLESAGLALRSAKTDPGGVVVYEAWMRDAAAERFELAAGLLDGIERGEFFLVYQPLFDLASQKVTSTEALLRWRHPTRGYVSPGVFIPMAEQTGAIVELGRFVLDRACRQLARWHQELPDGRGLSMSINVSARQLEVPGEVERLKEIIVASGADARSIIIELTESMMLDDAHHVRVDLEVFRAMGIRIAVDDFGTGAAGLGHLRDVPLDVIKIDKSYIDGLGQSPEAHNLITGVIELAHGMGAKIVAEGIETPDQARLLRSMRCDFGQGFYLGRPMEVAPIEEWFAEGRAGSAAASIAPPVEAANGSGGGRRRR